MKISGKEKTILALRLTNTRCLMGLIMMFRLLKIRFGIRFPAIAHLQKAPITASSENEHVSQFSVYRLKHCYLFQTKRFKGAGVSCASKHLR